MTTQNSYIDNMVNYINQLPSGTKARIKNILAYHYDAILRDIQVETMGLPSRCYPDGDSPNDAFTEYMEEGDLAALLNTLEASALPF